MKELGERKYEEGIKTITTGHWIFAAIFVVLFIVILTLAYRKDRPTLKAYYSRSIYFIIGIVMVLVLIYIFRQSIRSGSNKDITPVKENSYIIKSKASYAYEIVEIRNNSPAVYRSV